jgi:hypothetical protein
MSLFRTREGEVIVGSDLLFNQGEIGDALTV